MGVRVGVGAACVEALVLGEGVGSVGVSGGVRRVLTSTGVARSGGDMQRFCGELMKDTSMAGLLGKRYEFGDVV